MRETKSEAERKKCKYELEKKLRHEGSDAVLFFPLPPPHTAPL